MEHFLQGFNGVDATPLPGRQTETARQPHKHLQSSLIIDPRI